MNPLVILTYPFVWQALLTGIFIAISLPLVGTFLVYKNQSFLADALSHSAVVGVVIGVILNIPLPFSMLVVTLIATFLIEFFRHKNQDLNDSYLIIILSLSLSLAVILNRFTPKTIRLESYLFGDLSLVSVSDLFLAIGFFVATVAVFILGSKKWFVFILGSDVASSSGISITKWSFILSIFTAFLVAIATKIIGALLISVLIILPVLISSFYAKTFFSSILYAQFFAVLAVIIGFLLAVIFNLPTGAVISLVLIFMFFLSKISKSIFG